jgi:hypothetical protein
MDLKILLKEKLEWVNNTTPDAFYLYDDFFFKLQSFVTTASDIKGKARWLV